MEAECRACVGADPTGVEVVQLLAEAVHKVRADATLTKEAIEKGLVMTVWERDGLGSPKLLGWLKEMRDNNMLRLFGIAPST